MNKNYFFGLSTITGFLFMIVFGGIALYENGNERLIFVFLSGFCFGLTSALIFMKDELK